MTSSLRAGRLPVEGFVVELQRTDRKSRAPPATPVSRYVLPGPDTITGMVGELDYRVGFFIEDRALSQLHARAFAYPSEPPHVQQEPWAARLNRYSLSWVGAFHHADLVGFVHACWDGGRHAFLLDTVVDPDYRRRGAGTGLVLRLIDQVRHAGCERLHVDYRPSLDGFYQSCGFRSTNAGLLHLR